jgi:hypothetical protein
MRSCDGEEAGSTGPMSKRLLRGQGICERDRSWSLYRALAAATADSMRMRLQMQAAMAFPPHAEVVEPRGAGIKQLAFLVAPPACCRDHPFEVRTHSAQLVRLSMDDGRNAQPCMLSVLFLHLAAAGVVVSVCVGAMHLTDLPL